MGIVRKIVFSFIVLLSLNLSSQTAYDTIFFSGKKFIEHVVKGGESLRSIAVLHKVTTSEIKVANELNKRLFYNQLLYVPIYLNNKDVINLNRLTKKKNKIDTTIINVALLMPYYLTENDTNLFYNKSESALSFHLGVELAIDSLRRVGKKIILNTFDTNQDTLIVKKIVYSDQLDNMDIIIGPMYSRFFQILCKKYGNDNTKTLISPLSRDNEEITQFPSVYQIALTYKVQTEILTNYLIKHKSGERIIILNDEKQNGLAAYLKHRFNEKSIKAESFQVISTNVDSIRRYFIDHQNVLLLSLDKAFISKMLGSIGSIDSLSTVFSFESITSYDNLDIANLMELNVHIPNSRNINLMNNHDLYFVSLFEEKYNTNVRRYTKVGYDIIMQFCGNVPVYEFKQYSDGYFENISGPIYHYLDYNLVPVY